MRTDNKKYSLSTLEKLKEKINSRSDYQRPEVWKRSQKQLLIDSILRGYDIPKIYAKKEPFDSQFEYEIIDGQQRLSAIWGFFDGDFTLPKDAEPIDGIECASKGYRDLEMSFLERFNKYEIDFVIVTDAEQSEEINEIGELFLRLQNGTPLNAQEKRNAMPGNMRDFVKKLAKHNFFKSYAVKNTRYAHDKIVAQLTFLESSLQKTDRPTHITSSNLDRFYEDECDFPMDGIVAQNIGAVFDYLQRAFPTETPELVQSSTITLYCLVSRLIRYNIADGTEDLLRKWFKAFEAERQENEALEEDSEKDPTWQEYRFCISSHSDSQQAIEKRLKIMEDSFFGANPSIERI